MLVLTRYKEGKITVKDRTAVKLQICFRKTYDSDVFFSTDFPNWDFIFPSEFLGE